MRRRVRYLVFASLFVVVVGTGWLVLRPDPGGFSVRVIGKTNSPAGHLQIIYELTNKSAKDIVFALTRVEIRSNEGWHEVTEAQSEGQRELGVPRMLGRRSAAAVRIIAGPGDAAVRGTVEYSKEDGPLRAKMMRLAGRIGLPSRFWALNDPVFGSHPVGHVRLPEVERQGPPFLLTTTAWGVWPAPPLDTSQHYNGYMSGPPSQILDLYQKFSGLTVKTDPSVPLSSDRITVDPDHDLSSASEMIQAIEDALREQGGIVVAARTSNSVTFTWDEKGKMNSRR
jgi:hypothetical protein